MLFFLYSGEYCSTGSCFKRNKFKLAKHIASNALFSTIKDDIALHEINGIRKLTHSFSFFAQY